MGHDIDAAGFVRVKRSTVVLGSIVLAGCVHFHNRASDVQIVSQRTALMPLIVTAYELDASDDRETHADWEDAMEQGLTRSLERRVVAAGGHSVTQEQLAGCGKPCREFSLWMQHASLEIAAQITRVSSPAGDVSAWSFPGDHAAVRNHLDADFAMIGVFQEVSETLGRRLTNSLARRYPNGLQVGVVCVADLRSGRMAWCDARSDAWLTLRREEYARRAVNQLLQELYGPPQTPDPPLPSPVPSRH
jgi:hypothetical protein